MKETTCYSIYAVCGTCDHSLFLDYIAGTLDNHENDLIHQIECCPHQSLHAWQIQQHPQSSEIFEIENVNSREEAEESVKFWRDYFTSLGRTIVVGTHVCESFNG